MVNTESMYIHFPFCLHLCNYCDFYKHKLEKSSDVDRLTQFINTQLELIKNFHVESSSPIIMLKTLYLGGGTPSLWSSSGIEFFKEKFKFKELVLADNCEFTLEVDPGTISKADLEEWKKLGVNRLSIGVQSYDDAFLKVMDRIHGIKEIKELMAFSRDIINNFSFDLMIGLPESEKKTRDIENEIKKLIKFNPTHFSVYILKTRSNYIHNKELPSDEYIEDEYLRVVTELESHGYMQYEVSNFAKTEKKSAHNIQYWESQSVAAVGPNATGLIVHENSAIRYQLKSSKLGLTMETLDEQALRLERLYMLIRTKSGVNLTDFITAPEAEKIVKLWSEKSYLERIDVEHTVLNSKGFLMLDSLMDDLFNYSSF